MSTQAAVYTAPRTGRGGGLSHRSCNWWGSIDPAEAWLVKEQSVVPMVRRLCAVLAKFAAEALLSVELVLRTALYTLHKGEACTNLMAAAWVTCGFPITCAGWPFC
jgi:hypothetical protein